MNRRLFLHLIGVPGAALGYFNLHTEDNKEHRGGEWGTVGDGFSSYPTIAGEWKPELWYDDPWSAEAPDDWWTRIQEATWTGFGAAESKWHAGLNGLVERARADPQRAVKELCALGLLVLFPAGLLIGGLIGWMI